MASDATVAEITEPDIPEVADFLARQVRPGEAAGANPLSPERRLRWLLLENPARAPAIPFGWCIRGGSGVIVGAAICSPFIIGGAGTTCTALMFSKFFVDPPYRGMGLGILMRFVREGMRYPLFVTSTNAIAGDLFKRVGASLIRGMDHTMLGVSRARPLIEEWIYRKTGNRGLARIGSMPAIIAQSRLRQHEDRGGLSKVENADELAAINLPPPTDRVAILRNREYVRWRFFSGEMDKDVYRFDFPGEVNRMVVVNLLRSGYRAQIRVLNVLDIWPPVTCDSAPALAAHLTERYRGKFDVIWLRSQPMAAEDALRGNGFVRHAFPAPLGWCIDREKRLPVNDWYVMPGESE